MVNSESGGVAGPAVGRANRHAARPTWQPQFEQHTRALPRMCGEPLGSADGAEDVDAPERFVSQATPADEMRRLYEEEREARIAAEARAAELGCLNAILSAVNQSPDLCAVLSSALEQIVRLVGLQGGECLLAGEDGTLASTADYGLAPLFAAALRQRAPGHDLAFVQRAFRDQAPVVIADAQAGARSWRWEAARAAGYGCLLCVPILGRGAPLGAVVLYGGERRAFEPGEQALLMEVCGHLARAIERAEPFEAERASAIANARRLEEERGLYELSQQTAVLEERNHLARELHDSVTQQIYGITLLAQTVAPAWRRDPAEGERRINRLLELSQSALNEMRTLLSRMRPAGSVLTETSPAGPLSGIALIRQDGLLAALQQHILGIGQESPRIALHAEGYLTQPAEREEELFRIAQEALNNAVKHASASRVEVMLGRDAGGTYLVVSDDGHGFDVGVGVGDGSGPGGGAHLGLSTMRERAEKLGGTLQITRTPGNGTTVEVRLPAGEDRT